MIFETFWSVFEISAILLRAGPGRLGLKIPPGRAGPTWAENSSGPGRPGPKILPGRADLGQKFFRAGPGRFPKNKFDVKWPPN